MLIADFDPKNWILLKVDNLCPESSPHCRSFANGTNDWGMKSSQFKLQQDDANADPNEQANKSTSTCVMIVELHKLCSSICLVNLVLGWDGQRLPTAIVGVEQITTAEAVQRLG